MATHDSSETSRARTMARSIVRKLKHDPEALGVVVLLIEKLGSRSPRSRRRSASRMQSH